MLQLDNFHPGDDDHCMYIDGGGIVVDSHYGTSPPASSSSNLTEGNGSYKYLTMTR